METEELERKLERQIAMLERLKEEIVSGTSESDFLGYDRNRGRSFDGLIDSETMEMYDSEYKRFNEVLRKKGFGPGNRRSEVEIIATILEITRQGVKKTNILHKANLSYIQLKNYVTFLLEKGLLENIGNTYSTTKKGRLFLITWQNTLMILE
jgi:predicted transcriptional regulator